MEPILKGIDKLNSWMMYAAALILGGTVVLILLEIVLWNLTKTSTLITDEYSAYGLAVMVFWGAGYTLKEDGHIRITLLVNSMPKKVSWFVTVIATLASSAFMGYLLYYLYKMIAGTFRYETTSGTLTNTPIWIPQALMFLGAVAFFLQVIASFSRALQQKK